MKNENVVFAAFALVAKVRMQNAARSKFELPLSSLESAISHFVSAPTLNPEPDVADIVAKSSTLISTISRAIPNIDDIPDSIRYEVLTLATILDNIRA